MFQSVNSTMYSSGRAEFQLLTVFECKETIFTGILIIITLFRMTILLRVNNLPTVINANTTLVRVEPVVMIKDMEPFVVDPFEAQLFEAQTKTSNYCGQCVSV